MAGGFLLGEVLLSLGFEGRKRILKGANAFHIVINCSEAFLFVPTELFCDLYYPINIRRGYIPSTEALVSNVMHRIQILFDSS